MKNIEKEFNYYAKNYSEKNIIQKKVASYLVSKIKNQPKRILDIGCGSGEVYKNISWEFDYFVGIDFSISMCNLHPKNNKVKIYHQNFDNFKCTEKFDIVISSSALQWSKDLRSFFNNIKQCANSFYFAIFTSNTFKSIYKITNKKSPIIDKDTILNIFSDFNIEIKEYKLFFDTKKELFKYIKQTGISGGDIILDYKEAKKLYQSYNLNYLEFEVVFLEKTNILLQ